MLKYTKKSWNETNRNRVDSKMTFNNVVTGKGNPLYTEASSHKGCGWGDAYSKLTYDSSYEKSGRNLGLNNKEVQNAFGDESEGSGAGPAAGLIIGIIAAAVVICAVICIIVIRNKRRPEGGEKHEEE